MCIIILPMLLFCKEDQLNMPICNWCENNTLQKYVMYFVIRTWTSRWNQHHFTLPVKWNMLICIQMKCACLSLDIYVWNSQLHYRACFITHKLLSETLQLLLYGLCYYSIQRSQFLCKLCIYFTLNTFIHQVNNLIVIYLVE